MGTFDKVKDRAEQLIGEAKEWFGRAVGHEDVERAGKRDRAAGEIKETGHGLRDKAAGAAEDVKDKFKGRKR